MNKFRGILATIAVMAFTTATFAVDCDVTCVEERPFFNPSAQADNGGFFAESKGIVTLRNFYMNRDFYGPTPASGQSYREEWAQGVMATFESGFTPGIIGFGVNGFAMAGFKLDSGRGTTNTGLLPVDGSGRAEDRYGFVGGSVKARVSNTILTYGRQMVDTPVFSTDDTRLLPETAEGFYLVSDEIRNFTLQAGYFTALRAQDQSGKDSVFDSWMFMDSHNRSVRGLRRAAFIGGTYKIIDDLSVSYFFSNVTDFWRKHYVNLNYSRELAENHSIEFDFNYYHTKGRGAVADVARDYFNGHDLNSHIWSAMASYGYKGHKFSVGYQQSTGGGYGGIYGVDGGGSLYLGNAVQYSDFNSPGERSWQVRYDLDMEQYGVPGLSFMARYVRGTNIDSYYAHASAKKGSVQERELDLEARYELQKGCAQGLSARLRFARYRSSKLADEVNDFRFIVEYPWDLLAVIKEKVR